MRLWQIFCGHSLGSWRIIAAQCQRQGPRGVGHESSSNHLDGFPGRKLPGLVTFFRVGGWLSTHLKNMHSRQIGSLKWTRDRGVKIENVGNHHLVFFCSPKHEKKLLYFHPRKLTWNLKIPFFMLFLKRETSTDHQFWGFHLSFREFFACQNHCFPLWHCLIFPLYGCFQK